MPVNVIGRYPTVPRFRSGLYSLDMALSLRGEVGVPLRSMMELYGYTNSGKSTLAYYLAGRSTGKGNISICDLELADGAYIKTTTERAGLDGNVRLSDITDEKGKPVPHAKMLMNLVEDLSDEETGAIIMDSIGGIIPPTEAKGDYGEAFMGKRAQLVGQFVRGMSDVLRIKERPSLSIVINHVSQIIGGRGHSTIGGEALKFFATMRIMLWYQETFRSPDETRATGFLVSGKVEKLRYGGRGNSFQFYITPGFGVHEGASAMFDCFEYKLAERGTTVKLDGKSMGYLNKDLLAYAETGKQRKFEPFIERLKKYEEENRITNDEGE